MSVLLVTLAFTLLLLPVYKRFLVAINSLRSNYRGELIPISFGPFILLVEVAVNSLIPEKIGLPIWFSFLLMTIIGTYDDLYGTTEIKGLKGHIQAFFRGKITSGLLKAVTGGVIAFLLSAYLGQTLIEYITIFLIVLLMINTLNLFDLRPGRATKVFFILYTLLALTTPFLYLSNAPLIILGIMLIVYLEDIHAKIMLGDSGANLIGLHLGVWFSTYTSLTYQWTLIILLIGLHIYTEKYSLTESIENNKFLKSIDLLGRKGT